jgi:S-adenosylmethionine synthetase
MSNIYLIKKNFDNEENFEFIERKGIGHPDTLADLLAEYLSNEYSKYTLKRFGAILHHNFDKIGLLGGASFVSFGKGYVVKPIKVLINGRASVCFGSEKIPIKKLLKEWTIEFFNGKLYNFNPKKHLRIFFNLSDQSSPGKLDVNGLKNKRNFWFKPRSLDDLPELKKLVANDTSLGVGYAPFSLLEELVLEIEKTLNSKQYKRKRPWIGSDIKIMAFRKDLEVKMTICIPQIADKVKSIDDYKNNLETVRKDIIKIANKYKDKIKQFDLSINTRDNFETNELYLTATGSSIESGDEGLSGRGNRVNQVISPNKPMSIEGSYGKNPVYHVGKVYYLFAFELAQEIYKKFGIKNEIYLASQSGRDLLDPWIIVVVVPSSFYNLKQLNNFVSKELKKIPKITTKIINNKKLF